MEKIQNRLKQQAYAPVHNDINDDFPLRGFVTCGSCDYPMTACWTKGRSERCPYYMCHKKGRSDYRKSVRKEKLESDFESILTHLSHSKPLFTVAKGMFEEL